MIRNLFPILCLLLACSCSPEAVQADYRDTAWVNRMRFECPPVIPAIDAAWRDGKISVADLEAVSGAVRMASGYPIKGQRCEPRHMTPTSTRDVRISKGMTLEPYFDGKTLTNRPTMKYELIRAEE